MKVNKFLRVAIVGCGLIAQWRHIPCLLKIKNVQLVAVCDNNEDLVEKVAKRFRIGKYYTFLSTGCYPLLVLPGIACLFCVAPPPAFPTHYCPLSPTSVPIDAKYRRS